MSGGFKDIVKNGWHPEKSGGIRGSVNGLMGRNKDSASSTSSTHVSRPLSDLKDASQFAPPPRRTGTGLAPPPAPVAEKRKVITSPSKYADPRAEEVDQPPVGHIDGSRQAPTGPDHGAASRPYRMNTTGLSTQNLPKPPTRRDDADGSTPPPYTEAPRKIAAAPKALPPSLPPRLPPRNVSGSGASLNAGAVNRLGTAGVSVPALGIGRGSTNVAAPASQPSPTTGSGKWGAQVNELQGKFGNLRTSSSSSLTPAAQDQAPAPPGQGTTWAQKQAALKTASNFHKDPSSVSFSDAKSAATTANNFRQRHGDQIATGVKTANSLNQKYGLADKVNAGISSQSSAPPPLPGPSQLYTGAKTSNTVSEAASKKKPPPPPAKKKPQLNGPSNTSANPGLEPPPIPISTRPTF